MCDGDCDCDVLLLYRSYATYVHPVAAEKPHRLPLITRDQRCQSPPLPPSLAHPHPCSTDRRLHGTPIDQTGPKWLCVKVSPRVCAAWMRRSHRERTQQKAIASSRYAGVNSPGSFYAADTNTLYNSRVLLYLSLSLSLSFSFSHSLFCSFSESPSPSLGFQPTHGSTPPLSARRDGGKKVRRTCAARGELLWDQPGPPK